MAYVYGFVSLTVRDEHTIELFNPAGWALLVNVDDGEILKDFYTKLRRRGAPRLRRSGASHDLVAAGKKAGDAASQYRALCPTTITSILNRGVWVSASQNHKHRA